jgi:HD-GYP domain-containing protein (c-di-GMP phosphodiesterase class II)
MSELLAKSFLRSLCNASACIARGDNEARVADAVAALQGAADVLVVGSDEVVLSIVGDAFYLDRQILAHASTEFDAMLGDLTERGIDSITVSRGAAASDLADLAAFLSGAAVDLRGSGSVRLNDRSLRPSDLEVKPLHELRKSYSLSLDTLREVTRAGSIHLDEVTEAVDVLLDGGAADASSSMLLATVQNHDETTYYHSVNVCLLSMALGLFAGFGRDDLRALGLGALLHDVGRVVIDEVALRNPGRLTNEDWAQVRLHPQEGASTIMAASGPGQEIAAVIALEHHLRLDGSGYPELGGRQPHLFSRMVAIADSYEAITSFRAYRPARTPNEALRVLLQGIGTTYDPDLLRLFIQMTGEYPPGSLLLIDGGQVAMVTEFAEGHKRGLVVRSADGEVLVEPEPIDLSGVTILSQMMADEAGVDPGSLLESVEHGEPVER